MPARPRNNKTPDGGKRRWTPEERESRSGAERTSRPERASRPGRSASSDGNRAARREDRFGQAKARGAADPSSTSGSGRPSRRTDWSPGGRTNRPERASGGARRDDRGGRFDRSGDAGQRRDDRRPERGDRPERPQRSNGFNRTGRPDAASRFDRNDRGDRPSYQDRGDRPSYQDRNDRPSYQDRGDRPGYQDRSERPGRQDRDGRPSYQDRNERAPRQDRGDRQSYQDRGDRPQRQERFERPQRQERFDRPQRDERPRAGHRPDFTDRPSSGGRPDFTERPRTDRRPPRDEEPRRPWVDRAPAPSRDRGDAPRESRFFGDRDRTQRFEAPEDVVLEHLAGEVVTPDQVAGTTFAGLGLGEQITKALAELGAVEPFPIQAATIPHALAGRNVLGRGRTGSGKTIAFGAALVERLLRNWADSGRTGTGRRVGRAPRALVLAPTRELALQIDRTIQPIARSVGLYTTQIVGGVPQARQTGALAKGVDIVIGTPGRIEDLLEQGRLDLSAIEIAVLDEADHMAELGFLEPMQRLLRRVPGKGQRMLFSATLDAAVSKLVGEFLPNPAVHEVADPEGSGTADHRVLVIDQGEKLPVLAALVGSSERSLVFARTRAFAEQLADDLDGEGVRTESLHGDLNQARRTRNLARFSEGKVTALVATDVAARGIHVDDIDLVVHADSAEDYKTYLHRSGRTGRAGASGTVVTLITARRRRRFTELLERAGIEAEFVVIHQGDDPIAAIGR